LYLTSTVLSPTDYFYESFGGQQGRFGTVFHGPSKEMPSLMARVRLARKRKDVLPQLPDKIYTNIQISLDTTDGAIYTYRKSHCTWNYNYC